MNTESEPKQCHVCGDTASGINYYGFTCVSCRFFFQRNFFKYQKLTCRKEGKCVIDSFTRKSCPKCRLEKCIAAGMRKHHEKNNFDSTIDGRSCGLKAILQEYVKKHILEEETKIETENQQNLSIIELIIENQIPTQFQSKRRNYATNLTIFERKLIDEIDHAMDSPFVDERTLPLVGTADNLADAFNWPERYSKRIVKFCKSIHAFRSLSQNDQLAILKPFYMEILLIRDAFMYDEVKNGYPILLNEEGTQTVFICLNMANDFKCQDDVQTNLNFKKNVYIELEDDCTMRNLVIAQILFRNYTNVSSSEYVRYQYFVYHQLLRRYLMDKYKNVAKADKKFSAIQRILNKMDTMRKILKIFIDEVNASILSKWVAELYLQE